MHFRIARRAAACLVLALVGSTAWGDVQTAHKIEFSAPSVNRMMKFNLVLPVDYAKSTKRYPVLYLLHGLTSNYTAWATMKVPEYAANYDLIVVMPDVGNSWYVNWSKSDEGQKNNWEDFIVKDLVGYVDSNYRTIAAREGRAICGLSMGGFGGIMLGLRHPDMFCSCGSHSGALSYAQQAAARLNGNGGQQGAGRARGGADARRTPAANTGRAASPGRIVDIEGFSTQAERTPKGTAFVSVEEASKYDPFQLALTVRRDKLPHIYIDCGTDDRLIAAAQQFMKVLMDNKIPFTYAQSPGAHAAPYWSREVGHSMAVQYTIIQRALAAAQSPSTAPEKN